MEQLVTTVICFALGYIIGTIMLKLARLFANRQLQNQQDEAAWREYVEQMIHVVREDRIGDMRYWYDRDSETFLAQGKDHEEIISVLQLRFPDGIFVINDNQMIMGPEFNEIIKFDELTIKREN